MMTMDSKPKKQLGWGLGLRSEYYAEVLASKPKVDWFEVISENFMGLSAAGPGRGIKVLEEVREHYPIVLHGVSLSIGSTDALNLDYLKRLKSLSHRIQPEWISDHLCWTGVHGRNMHDLLPLPYTRSTARHVADRIQQVQDFLGRRILLENVSSYVEFECSEMCEAEFLTEVVTAADCLLLLDVNNIYVSSRNHGIDPRGYLDLMPANRVQQIHLAGHSDHGTYVVDTHDQAVCDDVWDLYAYAIRRMGLVSTMIERDDHFPPFQEWLDELSIAKRITDGITRSHTEAVSGLPGESRASFVAPARVDSIHS